MADLGVLASVLAFALVFAAAGYISAAWSHEYIATALISVRQDPMLNDRVAAPSDADRFVQSQVLVLNSKPVRDEVDRRLGPPTDWSVRAVQEGATDVVRITGTASSALLAQRIADTAADVYIKVHKEAVGKRADAALSIVEKQLNSTRLQLVASDAKPSVSSDAQRRALEAEYTRLLALRNQITVTRLEDEQAVASVATARAAGAERAASPIRRSALFGLLGAVAGLGVAIVARRRSGRILNTAEIAELDPAPILPQMPRAAARWQRTFAGGRVAPGVERAVRLQLSQLTPGKGPFGRPPVMLISTARGAGTSFTAMNLAFQSARRHPTLVICADNQVAGALGVPDPDRGIRDVPDGPWTVDQLHRVVLGTEVPGLFVLPVGWGGPHPWAQLERAITDGLLDAVAASGWGCLIDAPPLDESAIGLDLAPRVGQVVFVVGLGISTREAVVDALQTLRQTGATVGGLIVNRPPTLRGRGRRWFDHIRMS